MPDGVAPPFGPVARYHLIRACSERRYQLNAQAIYAGPSNIHLLDVFLWIGTRQSVAMECAFRTIFNLVKPSVKHVLAPIMACPARRFGGVHRTKLDLTEKSPRDLAWSLSCGPVYGHQIHSLSDAGLQAIGLVRS